ncbi:hypothetical protein E5288_WYG002861 [Bos mutus]|uniref:Uncharacterized protein n=1 Tax=Bos mutus TaxID=72004 RepID=A0A6B0RRW2_9CETA|nr:hypothetical protein [Bos mutus]
MPGLDPKWPMFGEPPTVPFTALGHVSQSTSNQKCNASLQISALPCISLRHDPTTNIMGGKANTADTVERLSLSEQPPSLRPASSAKGVRDPDVFTLPFRGDLPPQGLKGQYFPLEKPDLQNGDGMGNVACDLFKPHLQDQLCRNGIKTIDQSVGALK